MRRWVGTGLLVVVLSALGVAAGPAPAACACSCAVMTETEYTRQADVVFVGVAGGEVAGDSPRTVFTVERVVKGSVGSQVTVHSVSAYEASCGIQFTAGSRYEVYAQRDGDRLITSLCSGNRPLDTTGRWIWERAAARASEESGRPMEPAADSSPATSWPTVAGWGAGLGVLALAGLWSAARRRPGGGGEADGQKSA